MFQNGVIYLIIPCIYVKTENTYKRVPAPLPSITDVHSGTGMHMQT